MEHEDRHFNWVRYLVGPLIVGVIVLFGQSLLQPWVSEKIHRSTERWNAKESAFAQALLVVDKQLASHPFDVGPDAPKVPVETGKEPDPSEINSAYNHLALVADNREILDAFLGCLGARVGQSVVWHDDRVRLIQYMRKELGFNRLDLKPEDVRFWVRKLQQSAQVDKTPPSS